jgi:hypothetical protein
MARLSTDDPDFGQWVGVLNQGPMLSSTNAFALQSMAHTTPSAARLRRGVVEAGDRAPEFELSDTDGRTLRLAELRGKPLVMRLTRAVTDRIV